MKLNFDEYVTYLFETTGKELVVVDIQPAYKKHIHFNIESFINSIQKDGYSKILYLFNGPEFGFETEQELKEWLYEEVDYDEDLCEFIQTFKFYEKNYGFYRDLMDSDYDVDDIVKLIKYMVSKKENDSRDLDDADWEKLNIENPDPNRIYIPDVVDILKNHNNIHLCGGGKNECLKEVEICLKVLGKDYTMLNKWVY